MTSFTPKSNNDKLVVVVNSLNFSFVKDKVVLPQWPITESLIKRLIFFKARSLKIV